MNPSTLAGTTAINVSDLRRVAKKNTRLAVLATIKKNRCYFKRCERTQQPSEQPTDQPTPFTEDLTAA